MLEQIKDEEIPQIEDCPFCPISSLQNFPEKMKCPGKRCAWYDVRCGCCSIVSTAREFRSRSEAVFKGA